jgi:hypothetical protein
MKINKVNTHYISVACSCQFIEGYELPKGYSDEVKRKCLKMYVNALGFGVSNEVNACASQNGDYLGQARGKTAA